MSEFPEKVGREGIQKQDLGVAFNDTITRQKQGRQMGRQDGWVDWGEGRMDEWMDGR